MDWIQRSTCFCTITFLLEQIYTSHGQNNTANHTIKDWKGWRVFKDTGAEKRLIKDLLNDYDRLSRPRLMVHHPVTILVDLIVMQFTELDSKNQVLHSNIWLRLTWNDIYLRWNSTEYSVPKIMLPIKKLWQPDLVIENSADSLFAIFSSDPLAIIRPDGDIYVVFGDHISTLCDFDLTYYPFDEQNCTIKISNWLSDDSLVRTRNHFTNIDFKSYHESAQWSVKSSQVTVTFTSSTLKNLNFSAVEYYIQLKRKPFYHIIYMVVPSFVLSLIALLMFWLPPESGEKVSLGVTVFLSFSVLMFSLSDDLPESSDSIPVIGIYLMFVMNITAVWLVLTVAILNLHNNPSSKKPPGLMRFLAFNALAKVLCVDVSSVRTTTESTETESLNDKTPSSEGNEWVLLGRVFDRLCLYIFTIIDIIAIAILMLFYSGSNLPHPKHFPREQSTWKI